MRRLVYGLIVLCCLLPGALLAQGFAGMSGLINTPSAEMYEEGTARIGGYFLNRQFTPGEATDPYGFAFEGKKYHTADFYLSITPFWWVEIGYTFTLQKDRQGGEGAKPKYNSKDRYFSLKLNPLREGKYYPAIAIGANDVLGSPTRRHAEKGAAAGYFANYYIVATKHWCPKGHELGFHLSYRYSPSFYSRTWEGVVGGVTWRPKWVPNLRAIAEYTGNEVNVGVDCLLWKHLFLQAVLQKGKYFSGGICYQVNLF